MSVAPELIIAILSTFGAAYSVWRTSRKDEAAAKVAATTDITRIHFEADLKQQEMLTSGIEAHFERLEAQLARAEERATRAERRADELEQRLDALGERVDGLERERRRMLSWMAWNKIQWPPPEGVGF